MPLVIVPEPDPAEREAIASLLDPDVDRREPGPWWRAGVRETLEQATGEHEP